MISYVVRWAIDPQQVILHFSNLVFAHKIVSQAVAMNLSLVPALLVHHVGIRLRVNFVCTYSLLTLKFLQAKHLNLDQ